jgi:hypothetical protein
MSKVAQINKKVGCIVLSSKSMSRGLGSELFKTAHNSRQPKNEPEGKNVAIADLEDRGLRYHRPA